MTWRILRTNWSEHQAELSRLRTEVFVREQGVPEDLEWDEHDADATHFLVLTSDQQTIATARVVKESDQRVRIGRFAVRADRRRQGVGQALLDALLDWARNQGYREAVLSAQLSALAFYQQAGFAPYGEVYLDAGIEHRSMKMALNTHERA